MVDIAPFKGLRRGGPKKYQNVSDFICGPYDVISPEQRAALVKRSSTNVVQLELPSGTGNLKYLNARRTYRRWLENEVVQQDRRASLYLLETIFRAKDPFAPKMKLKRYGVLSGLRLEFPGKGAVRPHERTLPKAKQDRLNLLNSLRTNISPIFGLFFDSQGGWRKWVSQITKAKPLCVGKESKDCSHRFWKIDDPKLQKSLRSMLKKKNVYIADGHHRYEVAWAYKENRLKSEPRADRFRGWQYVMTYLCPMEEKGLLMLPTHRLVQTGKTLPDLKEHIGKYFDIQSVKNSKSLVATLNKSKKKDLIMGWVAQKGFFLLKLKKTISASRCLVNRSPSLRSLDVIFLHDIVLEEANGAVYVKGKNIYFTQDIDGMYKKAKKDPSWTGFVLRSAGVESLAKVASSGEVMPPKTTYFFPKVPTGFVLMPLNQKII